MEMRFGVVSYLEKVNQIFRLEVSCIEYAVRIVDRYLTQASLLPSENEMVLVCLTALMIAMKFTTEVDLEIDDLCNHFNLKSSQMVSLEFEII